MANIGTFTAQNDSFTGTVRTLTLNVKVKFVPNDQGAARTPPTSASRRRATTTSARHGRKSARPSGPTCR